ncbi:hypothetical protein [Streptomyces sp. SID12488]|uniref:hypothetical protein n=1 Tax=Streptomyces sp. SID12488 TaxID=2706040 RepID=UPI0013D9482C|nr:hypothetical protein [Streptomyces sp. SID12488]NEA62593.1 hypothetical protein [Streptomyces sp. SID12488]
MDLTSRLQDLHHRAGKPSYRTIERLIARQGRDQSMARSTIQEKLSGKSPATLTQILSLVEALAEHARLIESPIPAQAIDKGSWRDAYTASLKGGEKSNPSATAITEREVISDPWNVEPLRQAHMYDLIEIISSSSDAPVSSWLPRVISPLLQAEMSCTDFLRRAAKEGPREVVRITEALRKAFPPLKDDPWAAPQDPWATSEHDKTVSVFIAQTARIHGTRSTPAIIAGLRRANIGEYTDQYLQSIAKVQPASNISRIVRHLRSATLSRDSDKLLHFVGSERQVGRVLEVVHHFTESGDANDRTKILKGAATKGWYRIKNIAAEIKDIRSKDDLLKEVLWGIPHGEHQDIAEQLARAGHNELAQRVLVSADEPPF